MNMLSQKEVMNQTMFHHPRSMDNHLESTSIDLTKVNSECGSNSCHDKMLDNNICSMEDKSGMQSSESKIYSVNVSEEASTPQSIYSHGLVPDEDGFKMWECTMCNLFNLTIAASSSNM